MKSCGQAARCGYYGNDLLRKSVESSWTWFWPDFSVKSYPSLVPRPRERRETAW